ncbi:MAG: CAP domain-containing protein [Bacteroidia bacterium]|nr:CAP domain-containing protein [Bacteroidia bacterium]
MKYFVLFFALMSICVTNLSAQSSRGGYSRTTYYSKPKPEVYTIPDTNMMSIAKKVHEVVNNYRKKNGLAALKMQRELNDIAFAHSKKMATGQIPFSHLDFHDRVKMVDQYANIPYRTAENLYAHKISPSQIPNEALQGWYNSPGHKKNMDGQFIHTGIGVCRSKSGEIFITQLFVGKASFLLAGTKGVEDLEVEDETTGLISPPPPATETE